ncbi:MAG: hypothetical protein S4CHLAM123_05150 [Chlamydiales bacterium]|nr:hypothetical protein [Chlamydiales bacterium]
MKMKFLLWCLCVPASLCAGSLSNQFQASGWWGSLDYLLAWRQERFIPPLVTTHPTTIPSLSLPETTVLFGNESMKQSPQSGKRLDFGIWITPNMGVGGSLTTVGDEKIDFSICSDADGLPVLGRPLYDPVGDRETAAIISLRKVRNQGRIDIATKNCLSNKDFYARYCLLETCIFKFDVLSGYLWADLEDHLHLSARSKGFSGTQFETEDTFVCQNSFHVGFFGFHSEWRGALLALSIDGKLGAGNLVQSIEIKGFEKIDEELQESRGGMLTPTLRCGAHSYKSLEWLPQVHAKLQLKILPAAWGSIGYFGQYWPKSALAGEQIELVVPDSASYFELKNKSFWVQALSVGFYILY